MDDSLQVCVRANNQTDRQPVLAEGGRWARARQDSRPPISSKNNLFFEKKPKFTSPPVSPQPLLTSIPLQHLWSVVKFT